MSYEIDIQQQIDIEEAWLGLLKTAVSHTLTHEKVAPSSGLTLVLTDDDYLQQLNNSFRQIDAPTDILSFPADPLSAQEGYLGDIIISVPYATRHALADGHSLEEELQLLAVHGTLHLLGYDDLEDEAKAEMWGVQTAVLHKLGIEIKI